MRKSKRKSILASLIMMAMVITMIPTGAFAATNSNFVDMPSDWSTDALQKAVSNGLISGFDESGSKYIKPGKVLTRAQMATIVNRAFGAKNQASLSWVNDVKSGEWYTTEMGKAVSMGTFKIDTNMRPNDPITRQEAFTVLARAFKLTDKDNAYSLYKFVDGANVADFAKGSVCAMIDAKYLAGSNGYLSPTANISRAEFAKVMDNLVKYYCDSSGETFSVSTITGNLMINESNITIKNTTIRGDLIIGDGVGAGNVTLDNVDVTGRTIIRGGGLNTIRIKANCDIPSVTVVKADGNVRVLVESGGVVDLVNIDDGNDDVVLVGKFGTVNINLSLPVVFNAATINYVQVYATTTMTMDKDTAIEKITVDKVATGTKVINSGVVTKLVSDIKVTVSGTGTITENLATGGTAVLNSISAIVGTPKVGSELKAGTINPSGATVTYQWKIATSTNGTYDNIPGATSSTYTPIGTDAGKYIKLAITGKSSYTGTILSAATSVVTESKIMATAISGVTVPVMGAAPVSSLSATTEYTATIAWTPTTSVFGAATVYTATIVLTPKTGYTLTGITANQFKVAGATTVTNSANSGTITVTFPAIPLVTKISATTISGVTAPVIGATPVISLPATSEFTATVSWSPNPDRFAALTTYTATITLTPKTGYTVTGIVANQFRVEGATSTVNAANSGTITAVFPATPALVKINGGSIPLTAPVLGASPVRSFNTGEYSATVSWAPDMGTFGADTIYIATITLTPAVTCTVTGITANQFSVVGATSVSNSTDSGIVIATFSKTAALSKITLINIPGVTIPVVGATPTSISIDTNQYTATVSWETADPAFLADTPYTANISISPKAGYTLTGIADGEFKVDGATTSNGADSGTVRVVFAKPI